MASFRKRVDWFRMKVFSSPLCHSARVDGLAKREMTATEMVEHFENRPDFLHYRHTTFEKVGKKFESAESARQRPILVRKTKDVMSRSRLI